MIAKLAIASVLATIVAVARFKKAAKADSEPVVVPAPEEEEACETEFDAPEVTAGAVSETTQTRTVSTITASDGVVESIQEDEATSKPAIAAIDIDAVATADSFEVTPRKSSISKLMKKVSNAVSSPRKQSTV